MPVRYKYGLLLFLTDDHTVLTDRLWPSW